MRTTMFALAAGLVTASLSEPALAAPTPRDTPAAAPSPSGTEAAADTKRYCVKYTVAGSRLEKKMCKTRAEWILEDEFDPLAPRR
ncbi:MULTISPECIES: hypothetical protein [unclassified Sphingomonas]|uniref:hypothetical protein n=1 Tax=unclassified Sphingomonas TaxID=196159 RepID=UPI0021511656|nr:MULTISPECIES: hypothetical protein [unclassified Sphingomonas]MCR5871754.1 hypothetical protein [Sphingomonas sp. J344]UUX99961.1 hypothetical protein LRS08_02090 [Sphingomonas sp. J315]